MKTILITCFHPFVSRNLFAAPFFAMLKKQAGMRIVIACPEKKRAFLEKEYGAEISCLEARKKLRAGNS